MNNDGKYLETEAEDFFKDTKLMNFYWRRLHDAKSARNKFPAQPADFFYSSLIYGGCHLECKSVGGPKPRLKKFSQWAAMRRWAHAGIHGYLLVHFYLLGRYYIVDVMDLEAAPSWLLDGEYYVGGEDALCSLLKIY